MIDPVLYANHNSLQTRDARYVVDHYFHRLKWRSRENILDVGTGDGQVLFEIALPRVPSDFQKLVAVDIDEDMLSHARSRCKNYSNVELLQLDIATKNLPGRLRANFDHVLSFYCLQLVKEQR